MTARQLWIRNFHFSCNKNNLKLSLRLAKFLNLISKKFGSQFIVKEEFILRIRCNFHTKSRSCRRQLPLVHLLVTTRVARRCVVVWVSEILLLWISTRRWGVRRLLIRSRGLTRRTRTVARTRIVWISIDCYCCRLFGLFLLHHGVVIVVARVEIIVARTAILTGRGGRRVRLGWGDCVNVVGVRLGAIFTRDRRNANT